MKTTLRIFPLLLFTLFSNTVYSQESLDLYEIGVAERDNGHFSNALCAWLDGKYQLEIEGKVDPRIGIAFIELAAEMENRIFYDRATELYMWGFSGNSVAEFKETISSEVERIKPLLEEDVKKRWDTLLEGNDPLLLSKIRGFWFDRDLTPVTLLNERLIEHWERIVYSKEQL
ncbi:hypothetical protein IIB79_10360 [candidate division KSB1 bacterium]|nr:hypothetical protein [candidate division KSB1 bacterium]